MAQTQEQSTIWCPRCGSRHIKTETYTLPFDYASYSLSRLLQKYGMNCITEAVCSDCGTEWRL